MSFVTQFTQANQEKLPPGTIYTIDQYEDSQTWIQTPESFNHFHSFGQCVVVDTFGVRGIL